MRFAQPIAKDRIVAYIHRQGQPRGSHNGIYSGNFGRESLRGGRYDVIFKIKNTPWELARVEDIAVPAGGSADDPRLHDIDLGRTVRAMRIKVMKPDGKPLDHLRVMAYTPNGTRAGITDRLKDGSVIIVAPPRYDTFTLRHPEGTATFTYVTDGQAVTLQKPEPEDDG